MIFESILLSVTTIFISSLVFTHRIIKKQREWDVEDEREPEPDPVIEPFLKVCVGTPCPKCLYPSANAVWGYNKYGDDIIVKAEQGPLLPKSCNLDTCRAKKISHLHGKCVTCGLTWFMATADDSGSVKNEAKDQDNT